MNHADQPAQAGGHHVAAQLGAIGFLLLLIGLEVLLLWRRRDYPWRDAAISLGVSVGIPITKIVETALIGGWSVLAYQHRLFDMSSSNWMTWVGAFLWAEICLYWIHRWSHEVRWLWASHAVHHTPTQVVLPTAFRLPWTGFLQFNWMPQLLGIALGFPPAVLLAAFGVSLIYGFLLHTRVIGRLGPLEWVLNTPNHHRIHHSSELAHHDCNYGQILIVFDRLLGTFKGDTRDPLHYGIYGADPAGPRSVFSAALHEWRVLLRDMWQSGSPLAALRIAVSRPGTKIEKAQVEEPGVAT